jgi:RNA polymerase sigma factor (sigma-70 family)
MTQSDLLADFALRRNAESFAQIVEQYQRLIFATCRRKLHPDDVDDAVQETFLRLAQRAGEVRSNVGGWLHACAVNVAIDMNRRRSTRQRHESAVAVRTEKTDDPQQELAELREHLDAALLKLDPEERELIVQRYFVGRPQVELATEAKVSPSAISHRLDRAIENLRHHLKGMGCVVAATAGLSTLLATEHTSAAPPPSLTANVMKIGLSGVPAAVVSAGYWWAMLTVVAAVLVIVGGFWVMLRHSNSLAVQTTTPVSVPVPGTSGMVVGENPQVSVDGAPKWQAAPQADVPSILAGRILDSAGKPVANATIALRGAVYQNTKSDAQGNYSFKKLTAGGEYRIAVTAEGFVPIEPFVNGDPGIQLSADSHARRDLVLQRGVRIVVTVTNALGELIPNAIVNADLLGPGQYEDRRGPTNAMGQAKFLLPVSKTDYVVVATTVGYSPAHALATASSIDKPVEINLVLDKGYTVRGVAICSDNKPATGWKIIASPNWWSTHSFPDGFPIDKNGNFTLEDVGSDKYTLYVEIPSGDIVSWEQCGTVTMPPAEQPMRVNVPVPSPASRINFAGRVRFVDDKGTASPGQESIRVQAVSQADDRQSYEGLIQPNRNDNAALPKGEAPFDIGGVPPGVYQVSFESSMIERKVLDRVEWPGKLPLIELKVIGKPHLIGTVLAADTGKPVTQFAVRMQKDETIGEGTNWGQDTRWIQVGDQAGHFDVELVGPGVYQVQVSADGYAWIWSSKVRVESSGQTTPLQIKLTAGGSLSGVVLDPAGKLVQGAKVIPLSMARSMSVGPDEFEGQAGAATTDTTGRFALQHLAGGAETLKIVHPDFAPLTVTNLKVVDGQATAAAPITLLVGDSAEGTVFDEKGKPASGVTICFQTDPYGGPEEELALKRLASVVTDEQGHFRAAHLPHQVIYVNVAEWWSRQGVVRRTIFPVEGKTAHLDFGGPTTVAGRLLISGKPLANENVELALEPPVDFSPINDIDKTDADGRFIFYGTPPGNYTLYWQGPSARRDWIAAAHVHVTGKPIDLGEVRADVGDVQITLKADNPTDLSAVQYVSIEKISPPMMNPPFIQTSLDSTAMGVWRAKNVLAGHLRVSAEMKGTPNITFMTSFDRINATPQTTVTVHLPRASATLKISMKKQSSDEQTQYITLGNDDGTVQVAIPFPPLTNFIKLPPGSYRAIDLPFKDFTSIVLNDGQTSEAELDPSTFGKSDMTYVSANVWTTDGVLVVGPKLHLIDASGNRTAPYEDSDLGQIFVVHPGHYRAELDGAVPLTPEIDTPPRGPKGRQWGTFDLTKP